MNQIKQWIHTNPKNLFFIDGLGAILSAFLLGIVLVQFESTFGIPTSALYFLALLPCFFAIYDFYCYNKIDTNVGLHIKGIAYANLIYCFLSISLALYHINEIQKWGWIYLIMEVCLVSSLAIFELHVANKQINNSN